MMCNHILSKEIVSISKYETIYIQIGISSYFLKMKTHLSISNKIKIYLSRKIKLCLPNILKFKFLYNVIYLKSDKGWLNKRLSNILVSPLWLLVCFFLSWSFPGIHSICSFSKLRVYYNLLHEMVYYGYCQIHCPAYLS